MALDLKKKFAYLNRKYFGNQLPKDTIVEWSSRLKNSITSGCHIHGWHSCSRINKCHGKNAIFIHSVLKGFGALAEMSLLHEMVHLKAVVGGNKLLTKHGDRFQWEMLQLAKSDAFRDIW